MRFPALPTVLLPVLSVACSPQPSAAPSAPLERAETPKTEVAAPKPLAVTRVEPSLVCMVNNQYMGKAQIPIEVDGKTYFGCCDMCKSRLAQDAESRAALDPVSGARVDKARAVIGREASGSVVYFENEANLERYAAR